jgi:peptidoglycan/xylan/chitin deacetylase (PgdA/CDA1 family)
MELTVEGQVRRYPSSTQEERERTAEEIVRYLKTLSIDTRNQALLSLETVLPSPSNLNRLQPERYDFLNWEEVVEMSKKGVEFGSHTVNHAILSALDDETVIEEIQNSKTQIEAALQKECSCFSYPNGTREDFGDREKALLRKAGYTCAVAQVGGLNSSETDPFEIVRINITRGHDFYTFVAALTGTLFFLKKVINVD